MNSPRPPSNRAMPAAAPGTHEIRQRVRYSEVDRMGYLWHGHYLALFEEARTDWLRARGMSYGALEDAGTLLVVVEVGVRYLRPGAYEDEIAIRCRPVEAGGATLRLEYEAWRGHERLATGFSLLAATDRRGRPCRLPDVLRALVPPEVEASGTALPSSAVQGERREGTR